MDQVKAPEIQEYPKSRFLISTILLCLISPFALIQNSMPAALLSSTLMVPELGINGTQAGFIILVFLGISGVFMFIGSFIQGALGLINTIKFSTVLLAVGCLIPVWAPNYAVLMFGRVVGGLGYGISAVCISTALGMMWQGKALNNVNTITTTLSALFTALSYLAPGWIMGMYGESQHGYFTYDGAWRKPFLIIGLVTAVISILIVFLFVLPKKAMAETEARKEMMKKAGIKSSPALVASAKNLNVWLLTAYATFLMMAASAITSYLPSYYVALGHSANMANTATSISSIVKIAGSAIGGVLCVKLGKRKGLMIGGAAVMTLGLFGLGIGETWSIVVLIISATLGTFGSFVKQTPQTMASLETSFNMTPGRKDPAIITGVMAWINGISLLSNLFVSPLWNAILGDSAADGTFTVEQFTRGYKVFAIIALAGLVVSFIIKETGPGVEKKSV